METVKLGTSKLEAEPGHRQFADDPELNDQLVQSMKYGSGIDIEMCEVVVVSWGWKIVR